MDIDSIIFDLDGTLWDSTDTVLKAWDKVCQNNKEIRSPITREVMQSIMGLQVKQIGAKLFPYLEEAGQTKILQLCCEEERKLLLKEGGMLYKDLESILQTLSKSYSLFIVSNCQCGYIEVFLEYHKLGKYFKDFECAGNSSLVKGENIKIIMKRNNLEHPVYVGDTQGDCDAAKLANIPFIFASYGFGEVDAYDYIIEEISDIVKCAQTTNLDSK
ncbi:HAD family hydrolase [Clostridium tagluense]|uniref:HAD family hydrolase n=1 Tax=Clostridium tagluense TaxID=360422 RepID=UPI001C0D7E05|nr:HAD family hydrolase [Clostridium tagluense]MBU3130545.1 HAD family hydrolase [Clostridium tagluense]MBW9155751.1 HAD family hydrolase [Clostridium tagluense]WLC65348.1 HAD family hydrolase [Clostridium tagluense]